MFSLTNPLEIFFLFFICKADDFSASVENVVLLDHDWCTNVSTFLVHHIFMSSLVLTFHLHRYYHFLAHFIDIHISITHYYINLYGDKNQQIDFDKCININFFLFCGTNRECHRFSNYYYSLSVQIFFCSITQTS